jgi:hypothetical protein
MCSLGDFLKQDVYIDFDRDVRTYCGEHERLFGGIIVPAVLLDWDPGCSCDTIRPGCNTPVCEC